MVKQHEGAILPFLRVQETASVAKFRQLQDQLRTAILKGHLRAGSRLPASRILADELGIARQTIVRVLENLKAEGYLEARQGAGTYVVDTLPSRPIQNRASQTTSNFSRTSTIRLSQIGKLSQSVSSDIGHVDYKPFLPNRPAIDQFPFAIWRKCWNSATRGGRAAAVGYGDLSGELVLRQRIAEYLALHRHDPCDPEQIVITPGGHCAFALSAMALANPGDGIWFEDPGPVTIYNLFRTLGLKMCLVNVDANGMDVDGAIARHPDARLAFVMPSRHHPMGVTLSLSRRLAILEWAQRSDTWIIEDDYDSEFRYVGAPLPSMRSIDVHDRVIYAGSFSKALYPGLRIGYLVLPPQLVGTFRNLSSLINRSMPVETQLALADFIAEGHFANHLRRMRNLYAERRAAFIQAGQSLFNDPAHIECSESGLNALLWLPSSSGDRPAAATAFKLGLQTYPLSDYTIQVERQGALIMGFANVAADKMKPYLEKLATALDLR